MNVLRQRGRRTRRRRDESGSVVILVAVMLPVLILVAGISIDIGNWFEHRRHLQVQATAGALAAGAAFRFPCSAAVNAEITQAARDYSGDASDVASVLNHNDQIGLTAAERADRVHRRINSRFFAKDDTQNRPTPEDTDIDPSLEPCAAKMVDLKLTETDLPWFLAPLQFVDFIDARARVEIRKQPSGKGLLPIGVPDPNPTEARAYFIDEATGALLATKNLPKRNTVSNVTRWANDAPGDGADVPIKAKNIGVRIALSGAPLDAATGNPTNPLTGDPAVDCSRPLVECYDAESANGLVHIRGYSTATPGTRTAPQARSVELLPGATCADPYFTSEANCTVGVRAVVDFGVDDPTTVGATLSAQVGNKSYALTYGQCSDDPAVSCWKSATTVPVPLDGPVAIELKWTSGSGASKATGTFGLVQRAFGAKVEKSGPIRSVAVAPSADPFAFGNSFPRCDSGCSQDLIVSIGVRSALIDAQQSPTAAPVELRITGTGSQTQALNCDPVVPNLKDELAAGCAPGYRPNTGEVCPAPNALYQAPFTEPYPCVPVSTGAQPNQVAEGMNTRILGDPSPATCLPTQKNEWAKNFLPGGLREDDPRIVTVFLTPFGAFSGNGSGTVPVSRVAAFYVTGWKGSGGGFDNPCQALGDDIPAEKGSIVGHFMNYVSNVNEGGAGDDLCDPAEAGLCVPVLTR